VVALARGKKLVAADHFNAEFSAKRSAPTPKSVLLIDVHALLPCPCV